MKNDTHDSLCLLRTLLARIYRSKEWSMTGQTTQEAAADVVSSIEKARKLIRRLSHEIGRNTAMKILMMLNQMDKSVAYLKLELAYLEESQVSPETMKRVDKHAEWAINEVCTKFGEHLRCCEQYLLAVAHRGVKPLADQDAPRIEADPSSEKIAVEGRQYSVSDYGCQIVKALIDAKGGNLTASKIGELPGCNGKKIWQEIESLEDTVPALGKYLVHDDNNTYRICESIDKAVESVEAELKLDLKKQEDDGESALGSE